MAYPPYDFIARRDIPNSLAPGYRAGDGMYAQVAADYGLVIGVDVDVAQPETWERPADTATRAAWADYVLSQDPSLSRADLDDDSRTDLIARVSPVDTPKATAKKSTSKTTESGA